MTSVILFVFGTAIGSFLNVLALRFNSGLSLRGRSHCTSCGKKLGALELVPILSFLYLRGRCRACKARVSWQYPIVELWSGLVFMTVFDPSLSPFLNALFLAIFSLFIAITIYDVRHKIIPDPLVYLAIMLAALFRLLEGGGSLDYLAGPLFALLFAGIWFFSRGRAMGFGDAKLVLAIGFLLGWSQGLSAIVFSFWIGAACGISLIAYERFYPLFRRGKDLTIKEGSLLTFKSEIPFAPYLVLGAWVALIMGLDLLHVSFF